MARHLALHSRWIWRSRFLQRQFYTAIPIQGIMRGWDIILSSWIRRQFGTRMNVVTCNLLLLWAEEHPKPGRPDRRQMLTLSLRCYRPCRRQRQEDSFFSFSSRCLSIRRLDCSWILRGSLNTFRFTNEQSSTAFHWVAHYSQGVFPRASDAGCVSMS